MAKIKKVFHFFPSVYHKHIMDTELPKLTYKGGDVKTWQKKLRRKVRELLGVCPKKRVPLNVRSIWKQDHRLGTIEKVVFTSEPYADVPAYVCLPKNGEPPYPFMICLQGHSSGMHNDIRVDREDEFKTVKVSKKGADRAISCMKRGIAALCIEQRSFGERRELVQEHRASSHCHDAFMQAVMLGRTLIGERVFDIDRGIDYLATRDDADMKRIGCTGNSGGGTATVFASAVLSRITHAIPSCSFGLFRNSKMNHYHCACGYVPRIMQYAEMADVMGLFAPKPVVVVAGRKDPIVPEKAVREGFRHLKKIYKAACAEKHCHLVMGNEGHMFYEKEAWEKMLPEIQRIK